MLSTLFAPAAKRRIIWWRFCCRAHLSARTEKRYEIDRLMVPIFSQFDPKIVAAIERHLRSVHDEHHANVLLAIESGSRAWGFPSPDSDYDCRFIFARRRQDYLSLFPARDVIEFSPDGILDVNGWDLGKALRLLLKGNAVVIEWLTSPFTYAADLRFRDDALTLARHVARPSEIARH